MHKLRLTKEIPGVLRSVSGHHWGAANLVVFGPSWGYSAQDYALKNIKKSESDGVTTVQGDLDVPGATVKVHQEVRRATSASGKSALRVRWTLRSAEDGKPKGCGIIVHAFDVWAEFPPFTIREGNVSLNNWNPNLTLYAVAQGGKE